MFYVVEFDHGPHLFEARTFQKLFGVQRRVPFRQIHNREIEAAVGGGVQSRRNPLLVLKLTLHQPIAGRAVGNYVSLAHDARALHPERMEDALFEYIAVELAGDAVDEDAQRQVSEVAVTPFCAWRKSQRDSGYDFEKIVLGVVFAKIEIFRVVREPPGMTEEITYRNRFPVGWSIG